MGGNNINTPNYDNNDTIDSNCDRDFVLRSRCTINWVKIYCCCNLNINTLDLLCRPNAQEAHRQPFGFNFTITISVISICRTVINPKN